MINYTRIEIIKYANTMKLNARVRERNDIKIYSALAFVIALSMFTLQ